MLSPLNLVVITLLGVALGFYLRRRRNRLDAARLDAGSPSDS